MGSATDHRGAAVDVGGAMAGNQRMPAALAQMGFSDLRPGQATPINSLMLGRDTLCVLPTGTGKTAVFVIPTLCMGWRTLVFSPLVALMRDQVRSLWQKGVACAQVSGLQTDAENGMAMRDWEIGRASCRERVFITV